MDFAVWIEFGSGSDLYVHIDDLLHVEVPYETDVQKCRVLVDLDEYQLWACMNKTELWKVKLYRPQIIEESCKLRIEVRDMVNRRSPEIQEWWEELAALEPSAILHLAHQSLGLDVPRNLR